MSTIHVRVKTIEDKIATYVDSHPDEIYVDYRDELTNDQVDKVLEGKSDEVIDGIELDYYDYDNEHLSYYWEQCIKETGCSQEDIDEWLSFEGYYPSTSLIESDWKKLVRGTTTYITATLWDYNFNLSGLAYNQPVEYRDVRDTLKLLGVNPSIFRDLVLEHGYHTKGWFPNMEDRKPAIDIKTMWDNIITFYDGVVNFLLGDLEQVSEAVSSDSKYLIFKKGTPVIMYEFMNGAGIAEFTLLEDVKIKRKEVIFKNDLENRYGIQSCYGFVRSHWNEGSVICAE